MIVINKESERIPTAIEYIEFNIREFSHALRDAGYSVDERGTITGFPELAKDERLDLVFELRHWKTVRKILESSVPCSFFPSD